MKFKKTWFLLLVIASTMKVIGDAQSLDSKSSGNVRNEEAVLKYLRPVLKSVGGTCRLYYLAACKPNSDAVPFPRVNMRSPSNAEGGIAAVREIFENDKQVTISQRNSGIIQISIGKVPTEILETKIHQLSLDPLQQYNPSEAIIVIKATKEVRAAMGRLGVHEPTIILDELQQEPAKGLPHLPAVMKDLTMDQALDSVAKTFGGIVIYGACPNSSGTRLFWVHFVGVSGFELAPPSVEKRSK